MGRRTESSFKDGRLVSVMLDMKEGAVSPDALANVCGIEFRPAFDTLTLALSPGDFYRDRGEVYPKGGKMEGTYTPRA